MHGDVLGERARLSGGRTALVEVTSGRRWTYSELDLRASTAARVWLESLRCAPGDRVGVLSGNRVEMLDLFFAAGKSGVVLVPLNTRLTANELHAIVADCGLVALFYDGTCASTVAELRPLVRVEHWIALDEPCVQADRRYDDLVKATGEARTLRGRCRPEDPYCLLYTSGTTGRPKGVVTPHRMVAWNAYNTALGWQLRSDDVSPVFTPVYHAGGLGAFLMPILAVGGTIVLQSGFDAAEIWRTIEEERCTAVLGVPTVSQLPADAPEFARVNLEHAPLPRAIIDVYRERGVVLRQGYGLTEVGVNCFAMTNQEAWDKAGSIGRPLMFTEARVAGTDGDEAAVGEVGELCFRGPHVCAGYWNNPEATAATIDIEGWFHTGDMARSDDDGFFYIAGRAKDMFISGGVNVYPAEIENELLQRPELADAAVVGVPHPKWGEIGVAFVVPAVGSTIDRAKLEAHLAGRLARFKIPRDFVVTHELPRTEYGKVIKGKLVEEYVNIHSGGRE